MKTIAIVSAKGGVGKSSLAANLGVALHESGQPVLLVDLDPQNALGMHVGLVPTADAGIVPATVEGRNWRDVCSTASGVYVLPYGIPSEKIQLEFEALLTEKNDWLASNLDSMGLASNTIVILDTPPGPSAYLQQALSMANLALVVSLPDAASYTSLPIIERLINGYSRSRADFIGTGYVVSQANTAVPLSRDVAALLKNTFKQGIVGQIHQDQSMRDALARQRSVLDFAPYSQAAHDIRNCAARVSQLLLGTRPQS